MDGKRARKQVSLVRGVFNSPCAFLSCLLDFGYPGMVPDLRPLRINASFELKLSR